MNPKEINKFLVVQAKVVLTPVITPVILALDKFFEAANLKAVVTSGLRDAAGHLEVIREYLKRKGLDGKYPEAMTCGVNDFDGLHYKWQAGWSALLSAGVIINPPLRAVCLSDYFRNGKNLKGSYINQTPHAAGTAFNIGGGGNGVDDEAAVIQKALDAKLPGLVKFKVERENNAVHCDCKLITK